MKRLLLAGGGQAHMFVLNELARQRLPDLEVVLVTPHDHLLYSGMLPGFIAGHFTLPELTIPLTPLAQAAGAQIVNARMVDLDADQRRVMLDSGASIDFDLASIATGSVHDFAAIPGAADHALPLRPLDNFIAGWQRIYMHALSATETVRITVLGAGAGGCEIALAIAYRLRTVPDAVRVQLVTGDAPILPGHGKRARRLMMKALLAAGVRLIEAAASTIERDLVVLDNGATLASAATLLLTGAAAPPWAKGRVATDDRGFIAVDPMLRSTSHPAVFAAGDVASSAEYPRPKSGVYAVRAGPPLARNLVAALAGQRLQRYRPQGRALYLLATGPQRAIASWGSWAAEGAWAWRWKARIDRAYIRRFQAAGSH